MDLRELRFALRRHWLGAVLVFLVCTALGTAAAYLPEKRYEAHAQVFIQPEGRAAESAQAATFVTPGVVAKLQTRTFRLDAESRVPVELRGAAVEVTATSNASVLTVTVEGEEPRAVAVWANALVTELVEGESLGDYLSLSILDEAAVPSTAVFPQPLPILLGSTALGALAGVFVAVLSFRVRRAFDLSEDVRQVLGTRLLGELPRAPELRRRSDLVGVLEEGESELDDALHMVRVEMERQLAGSDATSVAVIAHRPGQGASTVAVGLAWSLAKVGHAVSVVDADARQVALAGIGENAEFLVRGGRRRHRPLRPGSTDRPALEVEGLGQSEGRPIEALTQSLPAVLERVELDDRFAVVDSPSLRRIGEARIVAGVTRRVIFVVDRSDWDLPALSDAVSGLEDLGAEVVGVVVNRVPTRRRRSRTPAPRPRVLDVDAPSLDVESDEPARRLPDVEEPEGRAPGDQLGDGGMPQDRSEREDPERQGVRGSSGSGLVRSVDPLSPDWYTRILR